MIKYSNISKKFLTNLSIFRYYKITKEDLNSSNVVNGKKLAENLELKYQNIVLQSMKGYNFQ